ncbi:MAG TPA: MBL fold metallo-hydrolase [Prolixibacteraceae bacterium]|nr:MBL fold metallo-hydrolase [Prolixibacteraceae bacterium]
MKIIVLNDNQPGDVCGAAHGLSFWVEADITFLFDTGPSDIFLQNARLLGINPDLAPVVVLSHGHYDHTGGLPFLQGKKLVCHPAALEPKFRKADRRLMGIPLTPSEIAQRFEQVTSVSPLQLSPEVFFLGEIPRENDFESKSTPFVNADGSDDFVPDDSGVAVATHRGLVVVSGCAHSGICNLVEHARRVTGIKKVHAVAGGFHLKEENGVTLRTIHYFRAIGVERVLPSHCTTGPALEAFRRHWPSESIRSGGVLRF